MGKLYKPLGSVGKSKLRMSPPVEAELERIREAAEYAASHPLKGGIRIATIRGYVRSGGRWYVEALESENPEPLVIDGLKLLETVENSKAGVDDVHDERQGLPVQPSSGESARET